MLLRQPHGFEGRRSVFSEVRAGAPFAAPGGPPGYLQFAMLHEIVHTIGIVPSCAPHQVLGGHASDSPSDLMYAGDQPWQPSVLDFGRDDYFEAQIPNCLDLATSGWLLNPPLRRDYKNASKFCKAEREFLGTPAFSQKYGGGASAHGKCVSGKNR